MLSRKLLTSSVLLLSLLFANSAMAMNLSVDIAKIRKANSNLSWAAAVKICLMAGLNKPNNWVWQGDMSYEYYGNRNAKGYNYQQFNYDMEQILINKGISTNYRSTGVVSKNQIYNNLATGNPVIITRRDKNDHSKYWALVIYAIFDNGNISVWDPQHGWDYTVPYDGFASDSRYDQLSLRPRAW